MCVSSQKSTVWLKASTQSMEHPPQARAGEHGLRGEITASEADPGLLIAHYKGGKVYVLVYVDDILVASKNLEDIQHVKHRLTEVFKVRDLQEAK